MIKNINFSSYICTFKLKKSLRDVAPIKHWSCKTTSTSVSAYFRYNIRASNFLGKQINFYIYWPTGPVDTKP